MNILFLLKLNSLYLQYTKQKPTTLDKHETQVTDRPRCSILAECSPWDVNSTFLGHLKKKENRLSENIKIIYSYF